MYSTSHNRSGIALIIVLSMIVLISAVMVAFMSRVATEGRSAKLSLQGLEARQASETAVNLVISQIRDATYDPAAPNRAWASQPGLMRTFEGGTDTDAFKLYSSGKMRVDGKKYNADASKEVELGFDPKDKTKAAPGYVDLNAPIYLPIAGKKDQYEAYFPICDPRAKHNENGKATAPGTGIVRGFHSADVGSSSTPRKDSEGDEIPTLPMIVQWLYQLRDGQLVAPTGDGDSLTIPNATATNPPIARIAFWTDDEGSKLNLNTASEPTYWDTPSVGTVQEAGRINTDGSLAYSAADPLLALAASQPVGGEYQRFPGHPATTSLAPAIRWLFPSPNSTKKGQKYTDAQYKESIYRKAPRILGGIGTTMGASRNPQYPSMTPVLTLDNRVFERDRLFPAVDDYFFRPDRSPLDHDSWYAAFQTTSTPKEDAPSTDLANPNFTPENLQRLRMFLTTSSRAPELNLFGLPRMSIWPIHVNDAKRSGFDQVIAFCSTVGSPDQGAKGAKFYFQRSNPWSATEDMTVDGARNATLYTYMMDLLARSNPAGGGSFTSKYTPVGMAQILTSMFDYIRCTNIIDTHNGNTATNSFPLAYTPQYGNDPSGKGIPGSGQITPLRIANTQGFGRFPTVSEVAIWCYYDDTVTTGAPAGYLLPQDDVWTAADEGKAVPIRCALAVEMFTPAAGYPALCEAYAYSIKELTPTTITLDKPGGAPGGAPPAEEPLRLASGEMNYVEVDAYRGWDGRFFQPTRGISNQFMYDAGTSRKAKIFQKLPPAVGSEDQVYPYISKRYVMRGQNNELPLNFRLKPGSFEIKIFPLLRANTNPPPAIGSNTSQVGPPIQTITVDFGIPSPVLLTLPVPKKHANGAADINYTLQERMAGNNVQVFAEDIVRSMEANGLSLGDYRLIAALPNVPAKFFARAGKSGAVGPGSYNDAATNLVHNLRSGWGRLITGAQKGKLTSTVVDRPDKVAKVPADVNGIQRSGGGLGDFDRGISKQTDGAYINKPDEGNMRFKLDDDYVGGGAIPYYRGGGGYEEVGESFFSPNRLISSAVMFGSLPNGVSATAPRPWETLLFRPAPQKANSHRGSVTPFDHYMLDLFHMPVVEPYPISEPLSTAGKININSMLAPFSYYADKGNSGHGYIERYTAVEGLLSGLYQLVVPSNAPNAAHTERPMTDSNVYRHKVDVDMTINDSFAPRLKKNGYFRSASEICEVDLLCPTAGFTKPSQRDTFWEITNGMTGDNQRERPYSHIYPRATTKSNVFTVHIWSQSLAKSPTSSATQWDESKDSVTGEYRGSTTIERYIDPADEAFKNNPDYQDPATKKKSLEPLYRYRIVNNKAFVVRQ